MRNPCCSFLLTLASTTFYFAQLWYNLNKASWLHNLRKQSNNLLSLNHADKRPLLVIVHVLTVDSIRNWWAEYKNTGSYSRCSLPFSLSRFSPSSLPFLHLPRMLNKRSLCYLSLVFICWENPRRSGILLFRDCPRFCWLMKTRNRRYHRYRLGWTGTNLENQECLYFPDASQICVMVGDHSRQMKTQMCTVGDVGNEFHSLPIP